MDEKISAAEANRSFSRLLRGVREGHSYVVTTHGYPVARLVPVKEGDATPQMRRAAKRALLDRLAKQSTIDIGP